MYFMPEYLHSTERLTQSVGIQLQGLSASYLSVRHAAGCVHQTTHDSSNCLPHLARCRLKPRPNSLTFLKAQWPKSEDRGTALESSVPQL